MFDLNPAVDHLMLDEDLPDPFDRDTTIRRPSWRVTDARTTTDRSRARRIRNAVGTRLIELGSALTVDDRAVRRPVAR
jgi:hypothetical protein